MPTGNPSEGVAPEVLLAPYSALAGSDLDEAVINHCCGTSSPANRLTTNSLLIGLSAVISSIVSEILASLIWRNMISCMRSTSAATRSYFGCPMELACSWTGSGYTIVPVGPIEAFGASSSAYWSWIC
ncbi:hypothetical protein R1flu_004332 [Riccia fluitans]|uniref:Uncharacterized protein n=1 Tax=Riccia fluitans TaxID=41844 RepID=A0ABD1YPZ5_9MARC